MSQSSRLFIPPLPSTKHLTSINKENESNSSPNENISAGETHSCVGEATLRRSRVGRACRPLETVVHETKKGPTTSRPVVSAPLRAGIGATASRVLRYGESVDSLFCLCQDSTDEHRKLCNEIANGDKADDPPTWREVLEVASSSSPSASSNFTGRDIIRLHKRATARFPIRFGESRGSSKREHAKDILTIWLLYAQAQHNHGSRTDARQTYRHALNSFKREGEDYDASIYKLMSEFELKETISTKGVDKAIEVIQMGIDRSAEPLKDLKDRLSFLNEMKSKPIAGGSASFPSLPGIGTANMTRLGGKVADAALDAMETPEDQKEKQIRKANEVVSLVPRIGKKDMNADRKEDSSDDDTDLVINFKKASFLSLNRDEVTPLANKDDTIALDEGSDKRSRHGEHPAATATEDEAIPFPADLKIPLRPSTARLVVGDAESNANDGVSSTSKPMLDRKETESFGSGQQHGKNSNDDDTEHVVTFKAASSSDHEATEAPNEYDDTMAIDMEESKLHSVSFTSKPMLDRKETESFGSGQQHGKNSNDDDTEHVVTFKAASSSDHKATEAPNEYDDTMAIDMEESGPKGRCQTGLSKLHSEETNPDDTTPIPRPSTARCAKNSGKGDAPLPSKPVSEERDGTLWSSDSGKKGEASSETKRYPKTPALEPRKIFALSSTRSLLARNRLGGGAKRVNSNANDMPMSDEDGESQEKGCRKKEKKKPRSELKTVTISDPVPKITKMDLSYMLNWDPLASRRKSEETGGDNESKKDMPGAGVESTGENLTKQSTWSTNLSNRTTEHSSSFHTNGSTDTQGDVCPSSAEEVAMIAKSNAEFLPLVSEDNILRVNSIPYAKLGVIGKGGSCKVYQALSKDCRVLAIKKVKLAGMDEKAISGYANEIDLLNRLRGNPAIIQMYDSEVDLKRKAIYLIMELGEADLNHVLQQQPLMDGEQKAPSTTRRNINFIRLTWQQMLSAVQCIHEERIIHGDLKPANFLFVRGTLKLIDFGIAKAIQSEDTTNIYRDSQIGTLNYMSPEAIVDSGSGENGAQMRCGKPSDVWALGCILYQMCYGRTPFAELHLIQKLQAIVNPNHRIKYPETIDEAAIDAIQLCLRRKPQERAPIIGDNGLLNEHWFLHSKRNSRKK